MTIKRMMTREIIQFGGNSTFCWKPIPRENSWLTLYSTLLEEGIKNASDLLGLAARGSKQGKKGLCYSIEIKVSLCRARSPSHVEASYTTRPGVCTALRREVMRTASYDLIYITVSISHSFWSFFFQFIIMWGNRQYSKSSLTILYFFKNSLLIALGIVSEYAGADTASYDEQRWLGRQQLLLL